MSKSYGNRRKQEENTYQEQLGRITEVIVHDYEELSEEWDKIESLERLILYSSELPSQRFYRRR